MDGDVKHDRVQGPMSNVQPRLWRGQALNGNGYRSVGIWGCGSRTLEQ